MIYTIVPEKVTITYKGVINEAVSPDKAEMFTIYEVSEFIDNKQPPRLINSFTSEIAARIYLDSLTSCK